MKRIYVVVMNHVVVRASTSLKKICKEFDWSYNTFGRKKFKNGKIIFLKDGGIIEIYKFDNK